MNRLTAGALLFAGAVAVAVPSARADVGSEVYVALGIEPGQVLSGTVLQARVLPGSDKQIVSVVTYFTGERDQANAVNVRLDVFRRSSDALAVVYSRDLGDEAGGHVGRGELQLLDLDGDGLNEIVLSWDDARDPLVHRRLAEVVLHDGSSLRTAWSGEFEYDATRAARKVPIERRDRWVREIDIPDTLRTRGITLFLTKKVWAVAGERLPEPQVVQETFPLRPPVEEP